MPFNPQTQYVGHEYLFRGISGAGNGIARGIDRMMEKRDREKEEDKNRARLFKSLQEQADVLGIVPKEKSTVMDLDTLQGVVQGHQLKQAMSDRAMATRERAQRMSAMANQEREDAAIGEALKTFSSGQPQQPAGGYAMPGGSILPMLQQMQGQQMGPDARTRMALQTPGLGGRGSVNLLNALRQMQEASGGTDWQTVRPREGQTESGQGYLYGKSGQFQFLPPQFDGGVRQVPVLDEGGSPTGQYGLPTGRGSLQYPKSARPDSSFHRTMDEITSRLTAVESGLADPKLSAEDRRAQQMYLDGLRKRGKAVIDRYHIDKAFDDGQRDAYYDELGLKPVKPAPAKSSSTKTTSTGTPAGDGKVIVQKDGKQFRLPKSQLEQAQKEGYTLVQ